MFDRGKIRYWITGMWLLIFILMWGVFDLAMLPKEKMIQQIESLENSIMAKNWPEAKSIIKELDKTWYDNKLFIQINTGSDEVFTFEQLLGQTHGLVLAENENALDFVSGMKVMNHYVSEAFPGP